MKAQDRVQIMCTRDYYHGDFRTDLALMFQGMDARDIRYTFGNDWMRDCSLLPRIPVERRPPLLVCLYCEVLVDQGMHTYSPALHRRFEELKQYPKFLVGFGHEAHLNPYYIFHVPIQRGLVSEPLIREQIPGAMGLLITETNEFFQEHMPEVHGREFFRKLLADPDVGRDSATENSDQVGLSGLIYTELNRAVEDMASKAQG